MTHRGPLQPQIFCDSVDSVIYPLTSLFLFGKTDFQSCSPFSQGGVSRTGADHQGIYA